MNLNPSSVFTVTHLKVSLFFSPSLPPSLSPSAPAAQQPQPQPQPQAQPQPAAAASNMEQIQAQWADYYRQLGYAYYGQQAAGQQPGQQMGQQPGQPMPQPAMQPGMPPAPGQGQEHKVHC